MREFVSGNYHCRGTWHVAVNRFEKPLAEPEGEGIGLFLQQLGLGFFPSIIRSCTMYFSQHSNTKFRINSF